jgi:hypothetical protein
MDAKTARCQRCGLRFSRSEDGRFSPGWDEKRLSKRCHDVAAGTVTTMSTPEARRAMRMLLGQGLEPEVIARAFDVAPHVVTKASQIGDKPG